MQRTNGRRTLAQVGVTSESVCVASVLEVGVVLVWLPSRGGSCSMVALPSSESLSASGELTGFGMLAGSIGVISLLRWIRRWRRRFDCE